ncbi:MULTISPECIES: DNA ligase D [unclassified Herbaspirillum]|uniref:DNA ligase D n=1 Tax=unclassified Herbaspirillum TaxID=2624150 RepID=UPI00114DFFA6|nr:MULTISPECIES: DNA ligase D [unclassified Herbaspirillum]MBB5390462.1 bifunctional non-homologous end joining protein LigD [Herbaspirillum sp. SJZ102]TQK09043.1 bifunctional non-homologous end joining protein LigD [Herbaspirillum sp. SJZ130]TQK14270.1 bifunctional non-homologous end joining protein LigD [Herbaspirillum sp. SJZ106]
MSANHLDRYRAKRNFSITPEPSGGTLERKVGKRATPDRLQFFIQRHHARRLHYDFRLELDGVLKSWAVPKGPSLDPHDKRLAVRVEDHPLDYGSFEGDIPEHQYGAGHVVLWDRGEWAPAGDPQAGLKKGHLAFELRGEKLEGRWALVRMGHADDHGKENWLLIKEDDGAAQRGKQAAITDLRPESVAGRGDGPPKKARRSTQSTFRPKAGPVQAAAPKSALKPARMPARIEAELATLAAQAPDGDEWLSEMKFDGYRGLCRIAGGHAAIYTREGLDWSKRWPVLVRALEKLPLDDAWIDGEVVALDQHGGISFEALQNYANGERQQADGVRLALYAFDLPYLNGHDLRELPLLQRKQLLRELIPGADEEGLLLYSEHIVGHASEVFRHACRHGMEGIVAKRVDAPYTGRRDRNWLKIKCERRQEFVIGGYTDPAGQRSGFGAILVGVYDSDGALRYAGRVGTGFDERLLASLLKQFKSLEQDHPAFANPPGGRQLRGMHWIAPKLVAEVKFAQWTQAGIVRHGTFVALREDKKPRDIVRETEQHSAPAMSDGGAAKSGSSRKKTGARNRARQIDQSAPVTVEGVKLTHPGKILFPDTGLTKLELARYYQSVARWILPELKQRPLSLVRCPEGHAGKCFFQKHAGQGMPDAIAPIEVPEGDGTAQYMMVNDVAGLVATVQMGVLELHSWGATGRALMQPDRVVFDLDPAPDVQWPTVVEGAQLLRGLLQEMGLESFLKTSGGKGLHLIVPIRPEHGWDIVKDWAHRVAAHLARHLPDRFIARMTKAARGGKIFVDYLRNAPGSTTVAAYSVRARDGAPVSVPITWEELEDGTGPDRFRVANMADRVQILQRSDPWKNIEKSNQRLTEGALKVFPALAK